AACVCTTSLKSPPVRHTIYRIGRNPARPHVWVRFLESSILEALMSKRVLAFTLLLAVSIVLIVLAQPAFAQNDGTIHLPPSLRQGPDTSNVPVRSQEEVDREQMRKAYELRQEEVKRDTAKLLQLSIELKGFIDKTNQGLLPVDAVKKAEQIEKLAHGLKS